VPGKTKSVRKRTAAPRRASVGRRAGDERRAAKAKGAASARKTVRARKAAGARRASAARRVAAAQAVFQEPPEQVFTSREPVIRRRLLLVEEDRHSIDELRDLFTERGYECEGALDLATARSILNDRMMDLTAVNAALPGVNDEEIIREFHERDRTMSLVVYNGTSDKARQRKLRSMGADSYLSKAGDLKAVAKAVITALVGRR